MIDYVNIRIKTKRSLVFRILLTIMNFFQGLLVILSIFVDTQNRFCSFWHRLWTSLLKSTCYKEEFSIKQYALDVAVLDLWLTTYRVWKPGFSIFLEFKVLRILIMYPGLYRFNIYVKPFLLKVLGFRIFDLLVSSF